MRNGLQEEESVLDYIARKREDSAKVCAEIDLRMSYYKRTTEEQRNDIRRESALKVFEQTVY